MRALFLIPGESSRQLQAFPAVAAVADQLRADVQVVCPPSSTALWSLHPAVSRTIPFAFVGANLADWANLLGSVREPDFQLCINRASGRQVDLMLSMSHIPTRIAAGGFSATERVGASSEGWPNQGDWQGYLQPVGVRLEAESFRLALPKPDLEMAATELPPGDGPLLLLAPRGGSGDWPESHWHALPDLIRQRLPGLRTLETSPGTPGSLRQQAARLASADVVLSSDPVSTELALLLGLPLVALGRNGVTLPERPGVQGLGGGGALTAIETAAVLQALGFN
jgi:ADP-heptose:LPS heptosyltransferase